MTERPVRVQALSSASAETHATNDLYGGRAIEDDQSRHEDALHGVREETRTFRLGLFLPRSGQAAQH